MEKNLIEIINKSKKLGLQQITSEFAPFMEYVIRQNPKIIIEIGCAEGAGSLCFSHFTKKLISLDLIGIRRSIKKEIAKNCIFHHIVENSNKARETLKSCLDGEKTDLLFIDGDHSALGAKKDFYRYVSLVRPGGIVAFHDIVESDEHKKQKCFVHKFWQEIKSKYKTIEFVSGASWGGIGVVVF